MADQLRVMLVFGTRPEAIKMMPVYRACKKNERIETLVCVTAQHRGLLDSVLENFDIKPDDDLDLMRAGQTLSDITSGVLHGMGEVLDKRQPDLVLVHGDTTTAFAAALAAFYKKIAVGHVEAGLRTGNPRSPFPEEMSRTLISRIASLHFAPTEANAQALREEGTKGTIVITGNTVLDVLEHTVKAHYTFHEDALNQIDFAKERWILLTAHRNENQGAPHEQIFRAIRRLLADNPGVRVVYPMHPNPAVGNVARAGLGDCEGALLIPALDVFDMHNLMNRCYMIMTDSGGLQEEAPSLEKPLLVLRTETERQEVLAVGAARLVGVREEDVYREGMRLLTDAARYEQMAHAGNPYGDGHASEYIVEAIVAWDKNGRPLI